MWCCIVLFVFLIDDDCVDCYDCFDGIGNGVDYFGIVCYWLIGRVGWYYCYCLEMFGKFVGCVCFGCCDYCIGCIGVWCYWYDVVYCFGFWVGV